MLPELFQNFWMFRRTKIHWCLSLSIVQSGVGIAKTEEGDAIQVIVALVIPLGDFLLELILLVSKVTKESEKIKS